MQPDDLHPTSRQPEVCHCCGRHAHGIATGPRGDRWLCQECIPLLEYVRDVRRWDAYEHRALEAVDEATSDFAAEHGTDMGLYDDDTRKALWRLACRAHQDGIRAALKSGPF